MLFTAGFVFLVLLLDLVRVPLSFSWKSFLDYFAILLGLGVLCLLARFACRTPTWRLPVSGHVVDLVTAAADIGREAVADGALQAVHWVSGSGPRRKRIRLNRKTPVHFAGFMVQSRPRVFQYFHS